MKLSCIHAPLSVMFMACLCATAPGQEGNSTEPAVQPETVIRASRQLSAALQQVDVIDKRLKELKDLTKREDGEPEQHYIERVERGIKLRTLRIHLLDQEVERALAAKYAMEDACQAYRQWCETQIKGGEEVTKKLQAELAKLNKDVADRMADVIVLAGLIKQQAEREQNAKVAREMTRWCTETRMKAVERRAEREAAFANLATLGDKQTKFDELRASLEEATLIARDYEHEYIPESQAFNKDLPAAHKVAFAALEDALKTNDKGLHKLELTATRLAIRARFTQELLRKLRPREIGDTIGKLDLKDADEVVKRITDAANGPDNANMASLDDPDKLLDAAAHQVSQAPSGPEENTKKAN